MQIKHPAVFAAGYEPIVDRAGPDADMLMDFGILSLAAGQSWESAPGLERAFLLMSGKAHLVWEMPGGSGTHAVGGKAEVSRGSLFDENPTVLHVDRLMAVRVIAGSGGAELSVSMTENEKTFPAKLYLPAECRSEERGKGTMREASTRIVRTVFDDSDAPYSNLVIGEVVGAPGKWSSYPPHHHPQPEIYHYRFLPGQGFGLTAIGDRAYMLTDRDTILIRDTEDHPQVTAPGYAMWYLWIIRHLEADRYITPCFTEAHKWVAAPDAAIWLPPSERT
ncbi:MAG: 5-deoxy-glucuronate isomerase [Rectinemataceae bacterium]|nr:5-deoxy-glucuronate isomerase [Rectinemataceae bacterium]